MNEEQLADLLAQHLDAWLAGDSGPETLPPDIADLLPLAQSLTETAPEPRPEFGPALKEALLGPTGSSHSAPPAANSTGSGLVISVAIIGLLAAVVIVAIVARSIIFGGGDSTLPNLSTATPVSQPTQTILPQLTPSGTGAAPTAQATATSQAMPPQLTSTATPVIDILPAITVTIEIKIEPPALVPGPGGGGGSNGDSSGDHNRGHGNDDDHHDDDNPGKGGGND